jgi:hypothetical protein
VKKTTLTISGASAYAEALLKDASISGRTILALQAEPDLRRSSSQAGTQSGRKPANRAKADPAAMQDNPENKGPATRIQDDSGSALPEELEPGVRDQNAPVQTVEPAARLEHDVISWNPESFASTKAALIEAETALGGIVNEAIVFIDPTGTGTRLPELSLGQIEAATTHWITGYTQLLRELGRRFTEHGSGLIIVVLLSGERGPLEAMALGAMESLSCSLAAQTGEAYRLIAVRDESGQPELLARYLMKLLDEQPRDSTKLLRHGGRISLFGK